jgi:transposase
MRSFMQCPSRVHHPHQAWHYPKKKTLGASEQDREDVQVQREQWTCMEEIEVSRLVFVDESGAKTNMTRLRGRAPRGQRVYDSAPHGHWHTTTMLSSMRLDGSTACMVVDGATDSDIFTAYVRNVLIPSLRQGDIVVMDNLAPHKSPAIVQAIQAAGAHLLYLPPYSPDFNPIEKLWSKIKEKLRALAARTQQELLDAIAKAVHSVTPSDAKGWFISCGYRYSQS